MSASPHPAPSQPAFVPSLRAAHPHASAASASPATFFTSVFTAWHLLSLDAPTVAALWVVFLARASGIVLPWTEPAAMFVAVWILYAADRLLDARGLRSAAQAPNLEARHRFHDRHRDGFYAALFLAFPALALLLRDLNRSEVRLDLMLGTLLFGWLLLIHVRSTAQSLPSRLPKELAVGVFFPAALFIPCVARVPALRLALLPEALLLAAVCSLNCLYIFAWEHPHTRRHAHWSTRWAVQRLPSLTVATTATAFAVFLFAFRFQEPSTLVALPALACAASSACLLLLHRKHHMISPLTLRAAADLCLLTPALLLTLRPFTHG